MGGMEKAPIPTSHCCICPSAFSCEVEEIQFRGMETDAVLKKKSDTVAFGACKQLISVRSKEQLSSHEVLRTDRFQVQKHGGTWHSQAVSFPSS